jgi:hypothetical protein
MTMATEIASSSVDVSCKPVFGDWATTVTIGMDSFCMEFGIPSHDCGSQTMLEYANRLVDWSRSILTVARARGDDDGDMPGTLNDALAAAEFFLHLSTGLRAAAPKMVQGI